MESTSRGAKGSALQNLVQLLEQLIIQRDFQEASLVFCALALHYRSVPEAIWKGGIEIVKNHSAAVFETGVLFYRQLMSTNSRSRDKAFLELGLYHMDRGKFGEAIDTLNSLKHHKSCLLNMAVVHGYLGYAAAGIWLSSIFDSIGTNLLNIDIKKMKQAVAKAAAENRALEKHLATGRQSFQQAAALDPTCDSYAFFLALFSRIMGATDVSAAFFEKCIAAAPSHPNCLRMLARSQRESAKKKSARKEAVATYLKLLQVDPTHVEAFKMLCSAYKQGLVTTATMTEVVALRLDYFPETASLWRLLAHLVSRVLTERYNDKDNVELVQQQEVALARWRRLVHWWKRSLLSVESLNYDLEYRALDMSQDISLWLYRGICSARLLSRVNYLTVLAHSRMVQNNTQVRRIVHQVIDQFELSQWVFPTESPPLTENEEEDRPEFVKESRKRKRDDAV